MSRADRIYRICKWGGILFLIAAFAHLCVADMFGDDKPVQQSQQVQFPLASEIPTPGALTWSHAGWLQKWEAEDDSMGDKGEFVMAEAPKSLTRGKSMRQLCRLTPSQATLPGSFEYRVVTKGKACSDGSVVFWGHYDPKTTATTWFDPRTSLTLRHSDGSGLQGQTFCPGAGSVNDTWAQVNTNDPTGGPYFQQLSCVTQANQRLGVDQPLAYEDAKPFINQFTSDLLTLVSEPECRYRYMVGCS